MFFTEEELTVEVGNINRVKIDDDNIFEAREGKVFENFTPKTSSTNNKNPMIKKWHSMGEKGGKTQKQLQQPMKHKCAKK